MYIYHSSPLDKFRVTVVAKYENGQFKYATARCGRRDQFRRKKGIMIATGRLNKGKCWTIGGPCANTATAFMKGANELASYLQKHSHADSFKSADTPKKTLLERAFGWLT